MSFRLTRRLLLAGAAAAALPLRPVFARAPGDAKLCVVILRGALDGLAAVPPYGERRLESLRGGLTPDRAKAHDLGDGFALHPSLPTVAALHAAGDAAVAHAIASPYRDRSHFDGQDVLESGTAKIYGADDGWLNRARGLVGAPVDAVGIGAAVPMILAGDAPAASWAPNILPEADDSTLARLTDLYAGDPLLGPALAAAIEIDATAAAMDGMAPGRGVGPAAYENLTRAAGRLLVGGAGAAVVSLDGWDTHANQGADGGQLANKLGGLDAALGGLKDELGETWARSVVLVVTEFGRTAAMNGTQGSDHGTGGAALVLGGAVNGGRVLGDWPGLERLHEDRDLVPANDVRSLFKAVLRDHWGLDAADLDTRVFPDSGAARAWDGVVG